jgi:hypothetical protein
LLPPKQRRHRCLANIAPMELLPPRNHCQDSLAISLLQPEPGSRTTFQVRDAWAAQPTAARRVKRAAPRCTQNFTWLHSRNGAAKYRRSSRNGPARASSHPRCCVRLPSNRVWLSSGRSCLAETIPWLPAAAGSAQAPRRSSPRQRFRAAMASRQWRRRHP